MENKGYKCPTCGKNYSALELQTLLNPQGSAFECEICNAEIEEHAEDPEKVKATQDTLSHLMEQTAPLVRLLKKIDAIIIPQFDPLEYLKQKQAFSSLAAGQGDKQTDGSGYPSGISNPSTTSVNIQIQIQDSETVAAPNVLPAWHSHSTVTGEQIVSDTSASKIDASVNTSTTILDITENETIQQYYEDLQSTSSLPSKRLHETELEPMVDIESTTTILIITFGGVQKALEDVTDADKSAMTPDEYAQYYEAYMSTL